MVGTSVVVIWGFLKIEGLRKITAERNGVRWVMSWPGLVTQGRFSFSVFPLEDCKAARCRFLKQ